MLTVCKKCDEVFQEDQGKCPCCGEPVPEPSPELKREEERLIKERGQEADRRTKWSNFALAAVFSGGIAVVAGFIIGYLGYISGVLVALLGIVAVFGGFAYMNRLSDVAKEYDDKMISLRAKYSGSPEDYERRIKAYIASEKLKEQEAVSSSAPKVADPSYTVKCPTCGSPNCERVSATSRAVSAAAFGLYSNKRNKQFKCNNCNYEW